MIDRKCSIFHGILMVLVSAVLASPPVFASPSHTVRPYFENEKGPSRPPKMRTHEPAAPGVDMAGRPVSEPAAWSSNIGMSVKPRGEARFVHGELTACRAEFRNATGRAVIILSFEPFESMGCARIFMCGRVPGRVEKMPENSVYKYPGALRYDRSELNYDDEGRTNNINPEALTKEVFYEGFLLPGQSAAVDFYHRPLSRSEKFVVEYLVAGRDYDGTAGSLSPFSVYVPAAGVKNAWNGLLMAPFEAERWNAAYSLAQTVAPRGNYISDRAVIARGAEKAPVCRARIDVEYDFFRDPSVNETVFSAEMARVAAAAIDRGNRRDVILSYSSLFNGYVVHAGDGCWILKSPEQKNRGEIRLPRTPAALFRDVDEKGFVVLKVGPPRPHEGHDALMAGWKLWGKYEVLRGGEGMSGPGAGILPEGHFVRVRRANFREFIEEAGEKRCRITQKSFDSGIRYYDLECPRSSY